MKCSRMKRDATDLVVWRRRRLDFLRRRHGNENAAAGIATDEAGQSGKADEAGGAAGELVAGATEFRRFCSSRAQFGAIVMASLTSAWPWSGAASSAGRVRSTTSPGQPSTVLPSLPPRALFRLVRESNATRRMGTAWSEFLRTADFTAEASTGVGAVAMVSPGGNSAASRSPELAAATAIKSRAPPKVSAPAEQQGRYDLAERRQWLFSW